MGFIIAANRFGRYAVPEASKHRPAARAILAGEVWEPETIAFMAAHCGSGDIVHAGTYFGDFLPALSHALAKDARLWAFEPSRQNFRCARRTVARNGLENVELRHAALGARSETLPLKIASSKGRAMGGSASVERTREAAFRYERAHIVALDDILPPERPISILQLDVEHFEQEALEGGLATVRRCLPVLLLENLPRDGVWFEQAILALGYRSIGKVHVNAIFAHSRSAVSL